MLYFFMLSLCHSCMLYGRVVDVAYSALQCHLCILPILPFSANSMYLLSKFNEIAE